MFVSTCPSCFVELWVLELWKHICLDTRCSWNRHHHSCKWVLHALRAAEQETLFVQWIKKLSHGLAFNMYSDVTELFPTFSNEANLQPALLQLKSERKVGDDAGVWGYYVPVQC